MEATNNKIFLTPDEVAARLNVHVATVYRFINRKENPLPANQISKRLTRVSLDDLASWIESQPSKITNPND